MIGVGVKVTNCPAQIGPDGLADMLTAGVTDADTTMVIALEFADCGLAQTRLEVMIQVTTCPLVSDELVNEGPDATVLPFTCH